MSKNTAFATIIVRDDATPSAHYPPDEQERNGATDYSVTIEMPCDAPGPRSIDSSITLYRDHDGRMTPCGSPLDGWIGGDLVRWIRTRSSDERREILLSLCSGPGEYRVEIEVG